MPLPDPTTGAMQNFSVTGHAGTKSARAGLVLLYAEGYRALPPAVVLPQTPTVIGRDASADVVLPVSAVSRKHAEIRLSGGEWKLRDLGSTNGTLLDGRRVDEATLETNAEVRIGDAIFKFVERGAPEYAAYVIDGTMAQGQERRCQKPTTLVGGLAMDDVAAALERIGATGLSVLLLGESGTGKEVAARELHERSGRRGAFSAVNCAALPENLIESELFGYKRGAFSGADRDKQGLIQAADGGTLLLDEIGDMPLSAQAKLLRVLQSREVMPIGATRPEPVDVRVVAATHRDLIRLEKEGKFRRDLYARLSEFPVLLPPLRDRKEDLYLLTRTFLARYGRADLAVSFPFLAGLLHHDWPYNVRELEAAIKRAIALVDGPTLEEAHLPGSVREAILDYARDSSAERDSAPSEEELRALLGRERGNVAAVGRQLGKARMQIHRWMDRYGIDIAEYRSTEQRPGEPRGGAGDDPNATTGEPGSGAGEPRGGAGDERTTDVRGT